MPFPFTNVSAQLNVHPILHSEHVNVKDPQFGALGDGSTDDTAAIQAAITAAASAGGIPVIVPPVSTYYRVTNQTQNRALKIAANGVSLIGFGYSSRIHNTSADSSCIRVGDDPTADTAVYTGVTIANLRLTQTLPHTQDDYAAISARSPYGLRVLNCDFDLCAEAISVQQRNATDAQPEACLIHGNRIIGGASQQIGIELYRNKGTVCSGNTVMGTGTTGLGIRLGGGVDNEVSGNFVRGTNSGISVQGVESTSYPVLRSRIANNRVVGVLGTTATGIAVINGVEDTEIVDNYIDQFVLGIHLKTDSVGGSDRVRVKGNRLRASALTTYCILGSPPTSTMDVVDPIIEDNYVDASAGANGIYLDDVRGRVYVLRNYVSLGSAAGIQSANTAAATETVSRMNVIVGANASQATDNLHGGSGKFVNYDAGGIDDNMYQNVGGEEIPLSIGTPAQITANQNDYDPNDALFGPLRNVPVWRVSSDAARNVTGIAGGWSGRRLTLLNVGAQNIVLTNQDALSVAGNRVITGTGANITMAADDTLSMIYDDTTARWRVVNTH